MNIHSHSHSHSIGAGAGGYMLPNAYVSDSWNDIKLQPGQSLLDFQVGAVISQPNIITKVQNPFDIVSFGSTNFDNAILTQLTPPHSPPQAQTQTIASLATFQTVIPPKSEIHINSELIQPPEEPSQTPVQANSNASSATQNAAVPFSPWNNGHSSGAENAGDFSEIQREMQIVDDIVNIRAKELLSWNDVECESMCSTSSSSSTAAFQESESEEWMPDNTSMYSSTSSISSASTSPLHDSGEEVTKPAAKKRTRPYGRGVEDRKIRKKEQNKNAATRYRQKKKVEMENVLTEEVKLLQRNKELQRTLTDSQREAKYLKALIREFYQQKKK